MPRPYIPSRRNNCNPIFIWWDWDNVGVPTGYDPARIYSGIKAALASIGLLGPLYVEMVGLKNKPSLQMIQRLKATGIPFVPASHSDTQASDEKIFERVELWLTTAPSEAVFGIISGDKGYSDLLSELESRRFVTVGIYVEGSYARDYIKKFDYNLTWSKVTNLGLQCQLDLNSLGLPSYAAKARLDVLAIKGYQLSSEEKRLWSSVNYSSSEMKMWADLIGEENRDMTLFNNWEQLIAETEKKGQIHQIRKIYDIFLSKYPLCAGYWKKYADHEASMGSMATLLEVFERAKKGAKYSVQMWYQFCIFATDTYGDPSLIRSIFEKALSYVGTDYRSSQLWDLYINYEVHVVKSDWIQYAKILSAILENPIEKSNEYHSRLIVQLKNANQLEAFAPSILVTGFDLTKTIQSTEKQFIELYFYSKLFEKSIFYSKISLFEKSIQRSSFSMVPLPVEELETWHKYLDFIQKDKDIKKVVKLFERCLIACANYPEFWIRYVSSMEENKKMKLAIKALDRATQVIVMRKPEIHLYAARFKEENGDIAGARDSFQLVHSGISPGHLEAVIKHANMENRQGLLDRAFAVYDQVISVEKGTPNSKLLPLLYVQYSKFKYLVSRDVNGAMDILVESLAHVKASNSFIKAVLAMLSFVSFLQQPTTGIGELATFIEDFIEDTKNATFSEREEVSLKYVEFLDMYGEDHKSYYEAATKHVKLFPRSRSLLGKPYQVF